MQWITTTCYVSAVSDNSPGRVAALVRRQVSVTLAAIASFASRPINSLAASVCLCMCLFVKTITSERVNLMKLEVGPFYKNLGRVRIWGHSPLGAHPKNVSLDYDVWKISASCLVNGIILFVKRVLTFLFL